MSLTNKQAWLRTICWLRREFPAEEKIQVRTLRLKELCGDADLGYEGEFYGFLIRINKKKNFETRVDTLLHEWAHCLAWFGAGQDKIHGPEFGIANARIYDKFLEWDFGKKKT